MFSKDKEIVLLSLNRLLVIVKFCSSFLGLLAIVFFFLDCGE